MSNNLKYFIIPMIVLGLLFIISKSMKTSIEGFGGGHVLKPRCPNVLLQRGSEFYLYNSRVAKVPGVNPLRFNSLDDYTEFMEWQKSQGIKCPILYLQKSYDTQGNEVYAARPSPDDLQGGTTTTTLVYGPSPKPVTMPDPLTVSVEELGYPPETKLVDASRTDYPYNVNSYPGYDKDDQYIGAYTPLDKMYHENVGGVSPNPMDSNWGGPQYTKNLVDSGYYKDNEVALRIS